MAFETQGKLFLSTNGMICIVVFPAAPFVEINHQYLHFLHLNKIIANFRGNIRIKKCFKNHWIYEGEVIVIFWFYLDSFDNRNSSTRPSMLLLLLPHFCWQFLQHLQGMYMEIYPGIHDQRVNKELFPMCRRTAKP